MNKDTETFAEEVSDILSRIPGWFINWGSGLIFIIGILIVTFSAFIKYPDVINGKVTITTSAPPVDIISETNGRINIFILDNSMVLKDQLIASIENEANVQDVLWLKSKLKLFDSLRLQDKIDKHFILPPNKMVLGNIQSFYEQLLTSVEAYETSEKSKVDSIRLLQLQDKLHNHKQLRIKYKDQLNLKVEESKIANELFQIDSLLMLNNSSTKLQFQNAKLAYLNNLQNLSVSEINFIRNEIEINNLESEILTLKSQKKTQRKNLIANLEENLRRIFNAISTWEYKFLIHSPANGKLSFSKFLLSGHYVKVGERIMSVVPASGDFFTYMTIPVRGSGKVEAGQKVLIELEHLPSDEYGKIVGTVDRISLVPEDENYFIKIKIPSDLKTSYNKNVDFQPEMTGIGEIITEDLSLLSRIFGQFRSLISNVS